MLQRMSSEHKISFLNNEKQEENVVKKESPLKKKLEALSEEQKAKKLNNKDNGLMTSHHISSARTGGIDNEQGPSKFIKSESSNTIFNSNKTSKLTMDNKEKTIQEKEHIATNKRIAEQSRMDEMAKSVKDIDITKGSSVSPMGEYSGSNYQRSKNNMSIFDTKDFQRMAEKTEGEKVSQDVKEKKAQKDESWKNNGKTVTSKDINNRFFNGLLNNLEKE